MAITPTGSPAWVRANGHETYGGRTDKENFQSQGAVNPQTDVDAAEFVRICADLAAIQRTAPFCTFTFTCDDSGADDPTIDSFGGMVDSEPTGVRNGDGDVTFTFSTSYADAYGVDGDVNIVGVKATVEGSTAGVATYRTVDDNSDGAFEAVRIFVWDTSGVAMTDATVTVTLYTGSV